MALTTQERDVIALAANRPPAMTEPLIHSFVTDCLPDDHPWAHKTVMCGRCNEMVHAFNNECMAEWVEWQGHALCLQDAITAFADGISNDRLFIQMASRFPCTNDGD